MPISITPVRFKVPLTAPGRGGEHAVALLAGYSGIVQCDGYAVYEQLADPRRDGGAVTLAFCWLHWRRYFFEIDKGGPAPIAHEALERRAGSAAAAPSNTAPSDRLRQSRSSKH